MDLVQKLARPPWHVSSTAELADALEVSFGRLSNWITRKQFVEPEPRWLFRTNGNRRLYRIDRVQEWATGCTPTEQAWSYLKEVGLAPDETTDIWAHVRMLEGMRVFPHAWRPRGHFDSYLAGLK